MFGLLVTGLKGMGYGMITIPTIINFYYTVIMAYAFLFLFLGFTSTLPWSTCDHDFNTINCHSITQEAEMCNVTAGDVYFNQTCYDQDTFCHKWNFTMYENDTSLCFDNITEVGIPVRLTYPRSSASEEFWYRRILGLEVIGVQVSEDPTAPKWESQLDTEKSSWSHWGSPRWDLVNTFLTYVGRTRQRIVVQSTPPPTPTPIMLLCKINCKN